MELTPYQEFRKDSSLSILPLRRENSSPQIVKDAGNIVEIFVGASAGAVAGGITGLGIDIFGWRKGALLGATAGVFFAGTGVVAEKLHVSQTIKIASSLAAGGLLAGTTGMLLTNHGVLAVSEAVGAGLAATLTALWLKETDEVSVGTFIVGTALAGALAGACEATKAVGGAVLIGSVAMLAKAAKVGFGKVSLWDAKDGLLLGAFLGQVLETSEALGASASLEIIEEASLAGAGLGAVVGAVYAEKCRQDIIAKSEQRETGSTPLFAAISIGSAAALGGYATKLTFKHIIPLISKHL